MLPAYGRLAGNSLFVRCHVTMNQAMNARTVLRKTPAINQRLLLLVLLDADKI